MRISRCWGVLEDLERLELGRRSILLTFNTGGRCRPWPRRPNHPPACKEFDLRMVPSVPPETSASALRFTRVVGCSTSCRLDSFHSNVSSSTTVADVDGATGEDTRDICLCWLSLRRPPPRLDRVSPHGPDRHQVTRWFGKRPSSSLKVAMPLLSTLRAGASTQNNVFS